jgi:hypothetical protein
VEEAVSEIIAQGLDVSAEDVDLTLAQKIKGDEFSTRFECNFKV